MSVVIKIDEDLQDELANLGTVKDTYNTVIWRLLNEHKERAKECQHPLRDGKCAEHGKVKQE